MFVMSQFLVNFFIKIEHSYYKLHRVPYKNVSICVIKTSTTAFSEFTHNLDLECSTLCMFFVLLCFLVASVLFLGYC